MPKLKLPVPLFFPESPSAVQSLQFCADHLLRTTAERNVHQCLRAALLQKAKGSAQRNQRAIQQGRTDPAAPPALLPFKGGMLKSAVLEFGTAASVLLSSIT